MIDATNTRAWVTGLGFVPTLNANQSWKVFEAIKDIATGLQPSKRVSVLPTNDGQGFIILVHEMNNAPTATLIANKFATVFPGQEPEDIAPLLEVHTFAGDNKRERIDSAKNYVHNNEELFEGSYIWRADWHPEEEPFEEPEEPPEGWPVSQPLEWEEIPEEE